MSDEQQSIDIAVLKTEVAAIKEGVASANTRIGRIETKMDEQHSQQWAQLNGLKQDIHGYKSFWKGATMIGSFVTGIIATVATLAWDFFKGN